MANQNALDFSDQAIIVTGGTRGVGRGIAERFLAAGAQVVVCGRNAPEELPAFEGRDAIFIKADVREPVIYAVILGASFAARLLLGKKARGPNSPA